jgi:hypothetical protein
LARNPLWEEGISAYFLLARIRRLYHVHLIAMGLLVFLWWPKNPITTFMQFESAPSTFQVVAVGCLIILAYLNALFGGEIFQRDAFHRLPDWLHYTPISTWKLLWGKIGFALLHALFLTLISVPFIFLAASPSGLSLSQQAVTLLILFVSSGAYRVIGIFLLMVFENWPFFHQLSLWTVVAFLLFATIAVSPNSNAILAVLSLGSSEPRFAEISFFGLSSPFYLWSVWFHGLVILTVSLLCLIMVWLLRGRLRLHSGWLPSSRRGREEL